LPIHPPAAFAVPAGHAAAVEDCLLSFSSLHFLQFLLEPQDFGVVAVVLGVNDAGLQIADCWGCYVSPLSFFFGHYAAFASATTVRHSPRLKPTARNIRLSIFASFSSFPVSQGLIMLIVAGVLIIVRFLASVLRLDAGMISLSELASMVGDIIL
jgi:hypothetical protein